MISKSLPTSGFKQIDPKNFDLTKHYNNCSKGCVSEVDLKYSKGFVRLYNYYPLALDKKEIKKEMLSNYDLKVVDF